MAEEARRPLRIAFACMSGDFSGRTARKFRRLVARRDDVRVEKKGLGWSALEERHGSYDLVFYMYPRRADAFPANAVPVDEWFAKHAERGKGGLRKSGEKDFAKAAFEYLVANGRLGGGPQPKRASTSSYSAAARLSGRLRTLFRRRPRS